MMKAEEIGEEMADEIAKLIKETDPDFLIACRESFLVGITVQVMAKREEALRGQLQYVIDKTDKLKPTAFLEE